MSLIIDSLPGVKSKACVFLCFKVKELTETVAWELCFEAVFCLFSARYNTLQLELMRKNVAVNVLV